LQLAEQLPAVLIRFETPPSILNKFTFELKCDDRATQDVTGISLALETALPVPRVAAGPWRSLGGCLDYSQWPDRDRFLELDRALTMAQRREAEAQSPHELSKWIEDEMRRT